ncbi:MAG TPA: bifunctional hydroxymethylpyrimidine kinase/phosphomethylpyrimidine kinase [Polyangiaceae bacterium]|nr:bifunctional hydroxymethylpyrimidine kinase/phosphomethylpyrimidine kinase [Polyangiaceae bacterium]
MARRAKPERNPESEATVELPPRVLAVGGTDPTGGAGLVRDVRTLEALGVHAAAAVTAVTVQTSRGVTDVVALPASVVGAQIDAALAEPGVDAIKTGMLASFDIVQALADRVDRLGSGARLIVDPVLRSSSGRALLADDGRKLLVQRLLPAAALVTPNLAEAAELSGLTVENREGMSRAADQLLALGASAVLIKGGHLADYDDELDELADLLRTADGEEMWLVRERRRGMGFRGTGCTLASAIAALLAEGFTLRAAVEGGRDAVERAMLTAPLLGLAARPLGSARRRLEDSH